MAKNRIGPRQYDGCEVYDALAKYGSENLWDVDISGRVVGIDRKHYPRKVLHRPTKSV